MVAVVLTVSNGPDLEYFRVLPYILSYVFSLRLELGLIPRSFKGSKGTYTGVKPIGKHRGVSITNVIESTFCEFVYHFIDFIWVDQGAVTCNSDDCICSVQLGSSVISVENILFTATVNGDANATTELFQIIILSRDSGCDYYLVHTIDPTGSLIYPLDYRLARKVQQYLLGQPS